MPIYRGTVSIRIRNIINNRNDRSREREDRSFAGSLITVNSELPAIYKPGVVSNPAIRNIRIWKISVTL